MVLAELAALEDAIEGTVLVDGSPDYGLARYDPDDVFRFHQSIPPAGGS